MAPRYAIFPLHTIFTQGNEGTFHAPRYALFLLHTIFTQGPEGPFRVLDNGQKPEKYGFYRRTAGKRNGEKFISRMSTRVVKNGQEKFASLQEKYCPGVRGQDK